MTSDGKLTFAGDDLDGRVNSPVMDRNNKLCVLIKVSVHNELRNPLYLSVGTTLEVIKTDHRPDGEVWFYVPTEVKNLEFRCKGYPSIKIPVTVRLHPGDVYRTTITANSTGSYVQSAVVTSNYLKVKVPEGATLYIGKTRDYELDSQFLPDGSFNKLLDYGEYFYKVEHEFYETAEGVLTVGSDAGVRHLDMTPAFSYMDIVTEPAGAEVFMDGRYVGTSPLSLSERIRKGRTTIRVQKDLYYPDEIIYDVPGDTVRHSTSISLKPRFATVTCICEDREAEIWIDDLKVGTGTWTGPLSSSSSHYLEARRKGHSGTGLRIEVNDGETLIRTIEAPAPLYGTVTLSSEPSGASVRLDGRPVGKTPLTLNNILTEDHSLELSLNGYRTDTSSFTLEQNQHLQLHLTLKEEDRRGTHNGHEWVNLGLNVMWATCNLGASSPSEYGEYYAWGKTSPEDRSSSNSLIDNKEKQSDIDISGNPQFDAATANWGKGWRMPTKGDYEDLMYKCKWEIVNQDGHNGFKVTGPNGNSIFLPAAGFGGGSSIISIGENGHYWSSTLSTYSKPCNLVLSLELKRTYTYNHDYDWRCSIRPVYDKDTTGHSADYHVINISKPAGDVGGHGWVDMGLSVMWAACNMGASSPFDRGDEYRWGDTTKSEDFSNKTRKIYREKMNDISGNPLYDAATANWGHGWRMPTKDELDRLLECEWILVDYNGYRGYKVVGLNGNSIFLPFDEGDYGSYWSSTPDAKAVYNYLVIKNTDDYSSRRLSSDSHYSSYFIRPVIDVHSVDSTFICNGDPVEIGGYKAMDLGLSVKWATCNIGASSPTAFGEYYAWGEIKTKSEYTEKNSRTYGKETGPVSGNPQYDAATANWGVDWRMPTKAEFEELIQKCTWECIHGGVMITGPNGNSIFLPGTINRVWTTGAYWSSDSSGPDNAVSLDFYVYHGDLDLNFTELKASFEISINKRLAGYTIRPVTDK